MASPTAPKSKQQQEDLDNFLTTVESKLRGNFSSLDLAKAVTSTRGLTPRAYLENLKLVFPRMDKVTKLRVLVALLGLDPSPDTDDLIYDLSTQAQEERLSEEWVKVIAGMSRGIMFQDGDGSRESCRGEDAQRLLEKSCEDVLERCTGASSAGSNENGADNKKGHDTDPLFSPYFYCLLNQDVLEQVLPDCLKNSHFRVNADADILKEDTRLEQKKAEDGGALRRPIAANGRPAVAAKPKARDLPTMPGIAKLSRAANKPVTGRPTKTNSSSMFVPAKKPAAAIKGKLGKQLNNMRRKPGSARAMLGKARRPQAGAGGSSGAVGLGATGTASANKFGANRSKMKMVDIDEVQGLHVEAVAKQKTETSKEARKRKLLEAAAAKGLVKKAKLNGGVTKPKIGAPRVAAAAATTTTRPKEAPAKGGVLVAAALAAYQSKQQEPAAPAAPAAASAPAGQAPNGEWTQHLEKSNRLTPVDRERVRQFFVDRTNPTPDQPVVRLKLHEEKTVEADTGLTVKETLYLELDYNAFGFKKLRKIKKK